jgi:hypothetical protein
MNNIYRYFRSTDVATKATKFNLTKRFDEPTYFSFRLIFAQNNDNDYNGKSGQQLFDVTCKRDGYDYELRPQGQCLINDTSNTSRTPGVAWFYTQTKQNSDGTTTIVLDFPVKYATDNNYFNNYLLNNGNGSGSKKPAATITVTGLTVSVWSLVKVPTPAPRESTTTRRLLK